MVTSPRCGRALTPSERAALRAAAGELPDQPARLPPRRFLLQGLMRPMTVIVLGVLGQD
jgi:hypothetical protein